MENENHPIIRKIVNADPGSYVIFFVYGCPYSEKALALLREKNVPFKGYDINKIDGGMMKLLTVLNQNSQIVNFNPTHRTKPIIFYDGKYLGGAEELEKQLLRSNKIINAG